MSIFEPEGGWPAGRTRETAAQQCSIEISLDQHEATVYTSGSVISGVASIRSSREVAFAALNIFLSGVAAVSLGSSHDYKSAKHHFLSLKMPNVDGFLPDSKVLEAKKTYTVPFNFTVPSRLSIGACRHKCSSVDVIEKHTRLPPSMGCWSKNDKSPKTTKIVYAVKARLKRSLYAWPGKTGATVEAQRPILVLPALPEDPPLTIAAEQGGGEFCITKEISSGLFRSADGKLTASVRQPHAVVLSADGLDISESWANVDFKFVPFKHGVSPPKIHVESVKIVSSTVFGTAPFSHIPCGTTGARDKGPAFSHCSTQPVHHQSPGNVEWRNQSRAYTVQPITQGSSRDRKTRSRSDDSPTKYTMSLNIPFTVSDQDKCVILPTFHTCFISRIHSLQLNFSTGTSNASISLAVPLQICVETACDSYIVAPPTFESIITEHHGGDESSLRSVARTTDTWSCTARILPPEYEASAGLA